MLATDDFSKHPVPAESSTSPRPWTRGTVLILAILLVGVPDLDAPWSPGREQTQLANHPLIHQFSGDSDVPLLSQVQHALRDPELSAGAGPLGWAAYAVQWSLSDGDPLALRGVDLLLHAANALLLWWLLTHLLAHAAGNGTTPQPVLAWWLALGWALHPALLPAYAVDAPRPQLLAALLGLGALCAYLRAMPPPHSPRVSSDGTPTARTVLWTGALACAVLAQGFAPQPVWLLLLLTIELTCRGGHRAWRAWRSYLLLLLGLGSTVWYIHMHRGTFPPEWLVTLWAVGHALRAAVWPFGLTPDALVAPSLHWGAVLPLLGTVTLIVSIIMALAAARRGQTRAATIGWIWFGAALITGVHGTRTAETVTNAALYMPLMGAALVLGVALERLRAAVAPATRQGLLNWHAGWLRLAVLLLAVVSFLDVQSARNGIPRAEQLRGDSDDPRAHWRLAIALDDAAQGVLSRSVYATVPAEARDALPNYFRDRWRQVLHAAAASKRLDECLPTPAARATFHRRLSFAFQRAGDGVACLSQAEAARQIEPEAHLSWLRLAQAYQMLHDFNAAATAYASAGERLPADPAARLTFETNYGWLLMFDLGRAAEACPHFEAAVTAARSGNLPTPPDTWIGIARCEVRFGSGETGYRLIMEVLRQLDPVVQPTLYLAGGLVLAEYHLRSHHWAEAWRVYRSVLADHPTQYEALRGFHEVCLQMDQLDAALTAWRTAARLEPGDRNFRSYAVWTAALARDPSTGPMADRLLLDDRDNPLACYSQMLIALRTGAVDRACEWTSRATLGTPLPEARASLRAAASLRLLMERSQLPEEAVIVWASIHEATEFPEADKLKAAEQLSDFRSSHPDSPWDGLAASVHARLLGLDVGKAP